jgi:hypothetical protein
MFKIFKKFASEQNDNSRINLMSEEDWTKHYKDQVGFEVLTAVGTKMAVLLHGSFIEGQC